MSQIIQGFKAINAMNVIHRDLKLDNILINFKNLPIEKGLDKSPELQEFMKTTDLIGHVDVVIADLGFAKELDEGALAKTQCGTPLNMAPEILNGEFYDSKVDVWSLGTVFFEMLTGFVPFTGMSKDDLKKNIEKGNYMFPKHIKLSLEGLDFLNCCLQHNPKDRMSWDDLMKHSYLNYDHTGYMKKDVLPNESELMLSYNEDSGIYSAILKNNPQY